MATFDTKKTLYASPSLIPLIAQRITEEFETDGYEVNAIALGSGGYDISIRKGGFFKSVLGMKTALKVSLLPRNGNIYFEAGVGIFGQQAIPTVISMFFFWPVAITQIWGLVRQAKLDDKALEVAQDVIMSANAGNQGNTYGNQSTGKNFCTQCGTPNSSTAKFCNACGSPLN